MTAPDRRLGGLSALAVDGRRLLALSDSGIAVWFDPPGSTAPSADLRGLGAVPGNPKSKIGRDSEALAPAPGGGWWVAFEQQHRLIRFDRDLRQRLDEIAVSDPSFAPNRGVEALVVVRGRPRWLAESSGVADATLLPDGRVARLNRTVGAGGFRATVSGWDEPISLPIEGTDNPEGIAAAPLPDGGTRLWIVTDNDEAPWRRTLLLAVDLPPPARR